MKIIIFAICVFLFLFLLTVLYFNFRFQRQKKQFEKDQKEYEEQIKKNTKAKESMESGSNRADFDASLNVLSKLKK